MNDEKARRLLPSIAQFFFIILFLHLSINVGNNLLNDGDTGIHIRAGQLMLGTRSIPEHDLFSASSPQLNWPTHEWLSQVIMAGIYNVFGLTGVVIFYIALISGAYSLYFRVLRHEKNNILFDITLVLLVLIASQSAWLARPHVMTIVFSMIAYRILDRFQYHKKNYVYLLPLLMICWVNLHGGFVVGMVFLTIYMFGNLLMYIDPNGQGPKLEYARNLRILGLTSLFCFLALLANPEGYDALALPFKVISSKTIVDNSQEFTSPNFHESTPFIYLLLLMVFVLSVSAKRLNPIEITLLLVFSYISLYSRRNIPLYALVVAPILSRYAHASQRQLFGRFADWYSIISTRVARVDEVARGYLWSAVSVVVVLFLCVNGSIRYRFDEKKFKPISAAAFLEDVHIEGNMFNMDEFGDYVIFSLYPRYKVFIDSRHDIYPESRIKEYIDIISLNPRWEALLAQHSVNWILYQTNSPLSRCLSRSNEWVLVHRDEVASVFVRNVPANSQVITKCRVKGNGHVQG